MSCVQLVITLACFCFLKISFNTIVLIFRTESTTMTKFKVKQGSLACMSWNCWCICVLRTKSSKLRSSSVRVKTRTLLILELLLVLMGTVMLHSQRGSMNTNQCDRAQQKQAVCVSPCVYPITITTYHVKKRHTVQCVRNRDTFDMSVLYMFYIINKYVI